jgi:hypothetical protein
MKALSLLVLAACTHDIAAVDRVDVAKARPLDLLYVFDNSPSRGTFDAMVQQLDVLQARLADVDGQLPDLHVGLVTTDLGTSSTEDPPAPAIAGCAGTGDGGVLMQWQTGAPASGYLEDLRGEDGERVKNYVSGNLTFELTVLTNPAPDTVDAGCEFRQPLEAMRRALDPATNPGFLRDDAMLSVVFLTTADDCSLAHGALLGPDDDGALGTLSTFRCTEQGVVCDEDPRTPGFKTNCRPREGSPYLVDVSTYEAFLAGLKPDRRDVVVSAVAGPRAPFEVRSLGVPSLRPSCTGPGGAAKPAVRLGALVDAFGGALVDGCAQEDAYAQITAPIVARQRACLPNLAARDGDDCVVVETDGHTDTELARCTDGAAGPCWYTYADPGACPAGDHLGIAVRRTTGAAPAASHIEANCFVKEDL